MHVSEAVAARKSVRAFLGRPVPEDLLRELLTKASRAPSGGNSALAYLCLTARACQSFCSIAARDASSPPMRFTQRLSSPYRDSRFKVGEDMYACSALDVKTNLHVLPIWRAIFPFSTHRRRSSALSIDRWGRPNGHDLGMFLQTFMLLAEEAGLYLCPRSMGKPPCSCRNFVGAGPELMLFCGMAVGYKDDSRR